MNAEDAPPSGVRREAPLTPKLRVPPTRASLVRRPHLRERLTSGLTCKVILVSAPAGYGKTTLVADWLSDLGVPFGWLALDPGDDDPVRFAAYLLESLGTANPKPGTEHRIGCIVVPVTT